MSHGACHRSLVLSNVLLMSARLLLAFTTRTPVRTPFFAFPSTPNPNPQPYPQVAIFVLYFLMPFGQALNIPVLTIAVRRYTNNDTRSIAYRLLSLSPKRKTPNPNSNPQPPTPNPSCCSWFYVVLNVAALLAAPAVDLMRTCV